MQSRDSDGKGKGKGSVCQMRQEVRTMKSDTKSMNGKQVLTDKELKKQMNKEALLESYNLSKRMRKRLGVKKKGNNATVNKVKRVDW